MTKPAQTVQTLDEALLLVDPQTGIYVPLEIDPAHLEALLASPEWVVCDDGR